MFIVYYYFYIYNNYVIFYFHMIHENWGRTSEETAVHSPSCFQASSQVTLRYYLCPWFLTQPPCVRGSSLNHGTRYSHSPSRLLEATTHSAFAIMADQARFIPSNSINPCLTLLQLAGVKVSWKASSVLEIIVINSEIRYLPLNSHILA